MSVETIIALGVVLIIRQALRPRIRPGRAFILFKAGLMVGTALLFIFSLASTGPILSSPDVRLVLGFAAVLFALPTVVIRRGAANP